MHLSNSKISNFCLEQSYIDELDINNAHPNNVSITNCLIRNVYGVSSAKGLPAWAQNNEVEKFQTVDTVSRIKNTDLSVEQRVFVTIIKKTFFQPGSGRKEEALLRGLGESADKRAANKIVNMLCSQEILEKIKGDEGWVYKPNRKYTKRMDEILTQLTLSEDPLWKSLSNF